VLGEVDIDEGRVGEHMIQRAEVERLNVMKRSAAITAAGAGAAAARQQVNRRRSILVPRLCRL
jgi:hypothetical protein